MLNIKLFNGFQARLNDQPLTRFRSAKARALFVYLLQESDRPHNRGRLAGLLWPDFPDGTARRNLSQTLSSLRKTLDESQHDTPYLETTTQTVAIQRSKLADGGLAVDTLAFERLAQSADHKSLQQAADLYTGPFLAQFQGGDSDLFENWALAQQERLQQLALDLFSKLTERFTEQNEIESAISFARRQLTLAPWQEASHRQLMQLLAIDGRRIEALGQYDTLCDVLMAELGVAPAPETDSLYDQILAGEIKSLDSIKIDAKPELSPPFQAPPQPPHFVGREAELAQVSKLVSKQNQETNVQTPIALVGMGGIGKTAFATHQAHQLKEQFSDGVLWANTMTSGPAAILDLWAKAYGYDYSGLSDLESKAAAVRSLLANKHALIVLDNVEDVAHVRPLLPNSSTCSVLLTTRNLDIASALNARPVELNELTAENSQQLMVKIIGEERVFKMTGAAVATQRIGELLHHLPLAIEIVAQRLKSRVQMPVAAMAMRLENVQQRLGLEISDQAVRSSFQVSWDGLPPLAQQVFRGMGIFEGRSFTANALAAALDFDLFETEDQLYSLTALSLVKADGKVRYRQHPLLADFAQEQLQTVDIEQIYGGFFDYFVQFANKYQDDYEKLSPEWDNLSAAIQAAQKQEIWQTVLDLTKTLAKPWFSFSRFYDAQQGYEAAEKAAESVKSDTGLANTYLNWAEVEVEQSRYDYAWKKLKMAHDLFIRLEDSAGIGKVKYIQGNILFDQGEYAKAEPILLEGESLLKETDDQQNLAKITCMLSWLYFESDENYARAEQFAQQALEILPLEEKHEESVSPLRALGFIEHRKGNLAQAKIYAEQALAVAKELNDEKEKGFSLYFLISILRLESDFPAAERLIDEAIFLFNKIGNRRHLGMVLLERSGIEIAKSDYQAALVTVDKAAGLFKDIEDRLNYAYALVKRGAIYQNLNQLDVCKSSLTEALQLAKHLNHKFLIDYLNESLKALADG